MTPHPETLTLAARELVGAWARYHGTDDDAEPYERVVEAIGDVSAALSREPEGDQIIRWSEVREGDRVLCTGMLRPVALAYLHHRPGIGERVHIEFADSVAGDPWFFMPAEFTAVRRCGERGTR